MGLKLKSDDEEEQKNTQKHSSMDIPQSEDEIEKLMMRMENQLDGNSDYPEQNTSVWQDMKDSFSYHEEEDYGDLSNFDSTLYSDINSIQKAIGPKKVIASKREIQMAANRYFIFTIVCAIALMVEIGIVIQKKTFLANAGQVQGIVSDVDKRVSGGHRNRHTEYWVYVDYEVNGVTYYNVYYNTSRNRVVEGMIAIVYYNKANPRDISDGTIFSGGLIGALFFTIVLGVICLVCWILSAKGKDVGSMTKSRM